MESIVQVGPGFSTEVQLVSRTTVAGSGGYLFREHVVRNAITSQALEEQYPFQYRTLDVPFPTKGSFTQHSSIKE